MGILNFPLLVFAISVIVLSLSAWAGVWLATERSLEEDERQDLGTVVAATLTLLGLIIGFTFSMAISRYDQRKNYEEDEANAIGTEYLRTDLLPDADAARVTALLRKYLDERILFYEVRDGPRLQQINESTGELQAELWSAVRGPAEAKPTPVIALAVSGMNDVLNSQGYTQAAWWNRIPTAAWCLMGVIAICCNILIGYAAHQTKRRRILFFVMPVFVSVAFFLIADIDSPRGGVIRVHPLNLKSLAQSLPGGTTPGR